MTQVADESNLLRVTFPARTGFLRISRLNAAAYAAELGLDVDDLDDLRLAVDEMVSWLLKDEASQGSITVELWERDGHVVFRGTRTGNDLLDQPVDDLVHAILGATVDSYSFDHVDGCRIVACEKRRPDE